MRIRKVFVEGQTIEQIAVILSVGTLVLGIIFATPAGYLHPERSLFFELPVIRLSLAFWAVLSGVVKMIGLLRDNNRWKKAGISLIAAGWGALFSLIVYREYITDFYPQSLVSVGVILAVCFTIAHKGDYK